jgi:hypothetical protein
MYFVNEHAKNGTISLSAYQYNISMISLKIQWNAKALNFLLRKFKVEFSIKNVDV